MRKLWVAMMSLGLAGGLAFAEDADTKDKTEDADRAPGAATGARLVQPGKVTKINAGGPGGVKAIRPGALNEGAPKTACPGCEEAKAKCQEAAKTSETHTGTAQCTAEGCGMHHGCDKDGNCYGMKCAKCLDMKLAGQKGRCEACKAKGPGAAMGAAAGPGMGIRAINQGAMQKKQAKPEEPQDEQK